MYSHPLALETANSNNRHNTYNQNQSRGRPGMVLIYILAMLVMDGNIEDLIRYSQQKVVLACSLETLQIRYINLSHPTCLLSDWTPYCSR